MVRSLLSRLVGRGGESAGSGGGGAIDDAGGDPESDGAQGEEAEDGEHGEDAEDVNDIWGLIPSWEYDGKYVQSGGHSRGEQERALQDIQRQAEEIERSESDGEPRPDR